MAKQKSIIKLQGTIDDISFVKTEDGYIAKSKSSVSAEQIKNNPNYQRTRENNSEFGIAGKAVKLIRLAFRLQLQVAKDNKLTSRMQKEMMKVVRADTTNARGTRNVKDGELGFFQNFEFNKHAALDAALSVPFTTNIDRPTGKLLIDVPAFVPRLQIAAPAGATHYQLISAGAELDFDELKVKTKASESAILPWDAHQSEPVTFSNDLPAGSAMPLMLVLGIQFFQMVNGTAYPLIDGTFNALKVVDLDQL